MRAAIYARRSTEEHQVASLDVQLEEARRYLAARGWSLDHAHVYIDDAISRAEFKKRPGLLALLNAAEARAFDVVITRDETRLGGDTYRTGIVIQDLLDHGARLFYYFTDEEVRLDGAVEKFLVAARSFASELEREKTSQRTHEHLMTKARRGLNVGGRVYGYDNVEIMEGDRRARVEYRINPAQADVVREIFHRYAAGEGVKTIAKDLNARGVPTPRTGKRGVGAWCSGSIKPMLQRERYRGVIVWGMKEKAYRKGTKVRIDRPECEWIRVDVPDLRIIDDELWAAVQARMGQKKNYGRSRSSGAPPRYLLSGFSRCGTCGGPIQVINGKVSYTPVKVYVCAYHRERGTCATSLRRPVPNVDAAVLSWLQQNILTEEVLTATLREVRRRIAERSAAGGAEVADLEKQADQIRAELLRLGEAIVSTTDPPRTLVRMMSEREKSLAALEARINALKIAPSVLDLEVRRLEKDARARLANLRALAESAPDQARQALEALLAGPLSFTPIETPEGPRFRVDGSVTLERVVSMSGVPSGIRTRVTALKGLGPGPG